MNSPALGLRVASVIFGLACLGQLTRVVLHISVHIGSHLIARRWSAVAVVLLAALCCWLWALARKTAAPKPAGTAA